MNNRHELMLDKIKTAGPTLESDRAELYKMLESHALQRVLFNILVGSDDAVTALTNADFTSEVGVKAAILLQAKARCYSAVVEDLLEFACTEPQPEVKETKNDN